MDPAGCHHLQLIWLFSGPYLPGVLGVTLGVKNGQLSALAGSFGKQHRDQKRTEKKTKTIEEKMQIKKT
jgi:hypothetical protein